MTNDQRPQHLRAVGDINPIWRLWEALRPHWRGPILGPGITNSASLTENDWPRFDLSGHSDAVLDVGVVVAALWGARVKVICIGCAPVQQVMVDNFRAVIGMDA
jgi:hypothetical protein